MRKVNVEDVIALNDDFYDGGVFFATRDGEFAYLDPYDGFIVLDDGDEFVEPDRVYVSGETKPIFAFCGLTTNNEDKEKIWTDDIDEYLATCSLELGEFHDYGINVNGDYYYDGWFDIESI